MDFRTGIEKGMAGVFHQMPAIRDLNRLRKRFLSRQGIAAARTARPATGQAVW